MREIKTGDKYLCKTSNYDNGYFTKGNIYVVQLVSSIGVLFLTNDGYGFDVNFEDLRDDFTDLQEETETKTPKNDAGLRYNEGKERWSLVDFEALKPMVKVLEYGANKYDDHNWKKGLKTTEICESLLRHLTAYLNGEDKDNETGLNHTGHILCNAMFLSYMNEFKKEFDTRYKKPCCGNWDELGNCKCNKNG